MTWLLVVAVDRELEPDRQRIDHRHADAMQAARHLVGILVELSAGMKLGHDRLRRPRRLSVIIVDVGGNAAAIVGDGAGAIGIERHGHPVGMAGQRLVDGIVDHLIDHVMQARAVIGVADIHAGALAHRIEALEHLDGIGVVVGRRCFVVRFGIRLSSSLQSFPLPHGSIGHRSSKPSNKWSSVPVIQAWQPSASSAWNRPRGACWSRWAATSSRSSTGATPARFNGTRLRQNEPDQQGLLLAGRALRSGWIWGRG